jgi:4-amino-4-deoxy-L-arabinose transferase-like glycosyltransferase
MIFGLGLAAFGAAKLLNERVLPGLLLAGIGIGLAALVRAPIAVVLGAGVVVGGALRRPSHHLRELGPIAKLVTLVVLGALALALAITLQDYLGRSGFEDASVDTLVQESTRVTGTGGSEFTPTALTNPAGAPLAIVTVLFRPFLYEAGTAEAVGTSIEATILLLLCVVRLRSFLAAFRSIRRVPYVAVVVVYVAGSIVALSAVANFGIIARQRTLLYPMFLVLMCFEARRRRTEPTPERAVVEVPRATVGARA